MFWSNFWYEQGFFNKSKYSKSIYFSFIINIFSNFTNKRKSILYSSFIYRNLFRIFINSCTCIQLNTAKWSKIKWVRKQRRTMPTLVIYFSAESFKVKVAKELPERIGADIFEIVPEQSYTTMGIKWTNPLACFNNSILIIIK